MNIITKIVVSIILSISGVTALYAQSPIGKTEKIERKSIAYRIPQANVAFEEWTMPPFHRETASFRGEIIKPVEAVWYNPRVGSSVENPAIRDNFFYDTTGRLIKKIEDMIPTKEIEITTYSNKLPADGYHHVDTFTLYKSDNMEPIYRYYCEYEIEQMEPYVAYIHQTWNKSQSRWDNLRKTAYTYLDTVSWYVTTRELYDSGPNNTFRMWHIQTNSLIYDESNNVSHVVSQATDFNMGVTSKMLYEYYYPESAHDNMTGYDSLYYYWEGSDDDTWIVRGKQTGITWSRWDGFDYESNQMASFYGWYASQEEEGEFDLWGLQKSWYDIDGIAGSWADTIYFYSNMYERWYTSSTESETYNEHGDLCVDRNIGWKDIELTGGILELAWYNIDFFENEYNDDGLLWRFSNYYTSIELGQEDLLVWVWEVTEFADVSITGISELPPNKNQLIIAPNPASGAITISAAAEIQQLQIFDIVGRLVHSHAPTSKEVVFDTGILEKGVYLVRALLKDGAVQRGKIVKN